MTATMRMYDTVSSVTHSVDKKLAIRIIVNRGQANPWGQLLQILMSHCSSAAAAF